MYARRPNFSGPWKLRHIKWLALMELSGPWVRNIFWCVRGSVLLQMAVQNCGYVLKVSVLILIVWKDFSIYLVDDHNLRHINWLTLVGISSTRVKNCVVCWWFCICWRCLCSVHQCRNCGCNLKLAFWKNFSLFRVNDHTHWYINWLSLMNLSGTWNVKRKVWCVRGSALLDLALYRPPMQQIVGVNWRCHSWPYYSERTFHFSR